MRILADVKIWRNCTDADDDDDNNDNDNDNECQVCNCKPMWCVECKKAQNHFITFLWLVKSNHLLFGLFNDC